MPPMQPLEWASGSELNRAQDAKRVVTLMVLDLVACENGDAYKSLLVKNQVGRQCFEKKFAEMQPSAAYGYRIS
jgi:hypothetical protein